jgi:hypothetical protein
MESAPDHGRWRDWGGTVRALAGRVPLVLWVLILLGLELRVALTLAYQPAAMTFSDSLVYVGMADGELFSDGSRSAGYSVLLRGLHAISDELWVTIAFQHLLGVATGILLYATFRRLGTPVWVAAVAAGGALLSLDQVFLEHTLLSEAPFSFGFAAVLYLAVRALDEPRPIRGPVSTRALWIAAASVALGLIAWVRPVAIPLAPLLALWFALALSGPPRIRLARAALATAGTAAALLAYAGLQAAENGYFGITRASGWAFYSRTAEFADCSEFDPPNGTHKLCESTPPDDRNGPDFYAWEEGSPAVELYGYQPAGNDEVGSFARAAILGQPLDYLRTVARDSLRYYFPSLGARPYGGVGYDVIDIDRRAPGVEEEITDGVNNYYDDEQVELTGLAGSLADLQDVLRLQPWLLGLGTVAGLAALLLATGPLRVGLALVLGLSAALLVVPPATAIWSARYAVPITGPLLGAAATGVWLASVRLRDFRRAPGSA